MGSKQISVVIPSPLKRWLLTYCADTGVQASELLRLLVVREKRLQRLSKLDVLPTPSIEDGDRTSLTAYFKSEIEVEEFDAYTRTINMRRRQAALILLVLERDERWLDLALSAS